MILPHKTCQKVKIKGKRYIIRIGAYDGTFWRRLMSASNHSPCINCYPDICMTNVQLFNIFWFRDFLEGMLQSNINEEIEGEKVLHEEFLVFFWYD